MKQKLWKITAILCTFIGLFMVGVSLFFLYLFFDEISNPYGNEFIQVFYAFFMYSVPFWIVASVSIYKIKRILPKYIYFAIYTITSIVVLLSLIITIIAIIQF